MTEFLEAISGCWKWLGQALASSNDRDRAPGENQCLADVQEWKCNSGTAPAARRATDFLDHLIDQGFIYLVRRLAPNLFPIQSQSTFIEEACWQSSALWPFPRRSEPSADGTSVLICESPPRLNSHLRTHCALSIILSASLFFHAVKRVQGVQECTASLLLNKGEEHLADPLHSTTMQRCPCNWVIFFTVIPSACFSITHLS